MRDSSGNPGAGHGRYLMFGLNNEEYGVAVLKVREIVGMLPLRPIPRTPPFVKGVINLRGGIVPVIDLKLCLGLKAERGNGRTCIIVLDLSVEDSLVAVGILVDWVSEVKHIGANQVQSPPLLGMGPRARFIEGIYMTEGGVRILLDIEKVLRDESLAVPGPSEWARQQTLARESEQCGREPGFLSGSDPGEDLGFRVPGWDQVLWKSQLVENPGHNEPADVFETPGMMVKTGHGRENDAPRLRKP